MSAVHEGQGLSSPSSSNTIVLPDNIQRLFIDVKAHLLPHLNDAAVNGVLDDAERELHDGLARVERALNVWAIDVVDVGKNAKERQAWQDVVRSAQSDLKTLRQTSAKALIQARSAQRRAQMQTASGGGLAGARNALFADMTTSEEERRRRREARTHDQTADEQLMTASGDVTAALQRAVQLMSTELEKSSYSAQLLDESSVSIQQATVQYTSFTALVASSRKLIASMERADMIGAAMLLFSFLFFAGCILYILKVRIWDRGVGILSFFVRMSGLVSSRSPADVKEKLALAKQAALQSSSSVSSASIASSLSSAALAASSSAAAAAAATAASVAAAAAAAAAASSSSSSMSASLSAASAAAQSSQDSQALNELPKPSDSIAHDPAAKPSGGEVEQVTHDEL